MKALQHASPHAAYELRFHGGTGNGVAFSFPCDMQGHVDMDVLDDRARNDYLFVRAVMKLGRESVAPALLCNARQGT